MSTPRRHCNRSGLIGRWVEGCRRVGGVLFTMTTNLGRGDCFGRFKKRGLTNKSWLNTGRMRSLSCDTVQHQVRGVGFLSQRRSSPGGWSSLDGRLEGGWLAQMGGSQGGLVPSKQGSSLGAPRQRRLVHDSLKLAHRSSSV